MHASPPKKRPRNQGVENLLPNLQIRIPQAARLRQRQLQPWHLEILGVHAPRELEIHLTFNDDLIHTTPLDTYAACA
jgi:hypothetical protein